MKEKKAAIDPMIFDIRLLCESEDVVILDHDLAKTRRGVNAQDSAKHGAGAMAARAVISGG